MVESIYLAAQTVGLPTAVYKLISSDCGAHRMRSTANKKRASYYSRVVNWLTVVRAQFNINRTSIEIEVYRETVGWSVSFMWDSPQSSLLYAVYQFT